MMTTPIVRVGQGWDIHKLVVGRPLILGGVTIPFAKGALGHSDADALLHAIIDALLGAAGLGDIGRHFPDTDIRYQGADSRFLLRTAISLLKAAGWRIENIDASILLEQPKLAPHILSMRHNIASDVEVTLEQVNIKAKTYEKLGPVGQGEAVEAQAICLLARA
jgi:2-C-methyl-D-erythritol 2,4-cyclodiphosphate synthase